MEGEVYKKQLFKRWTEHYMISDRRKLYYFNAHKPETPYEQHAAYCLDLTELTGLDTDVTEKNIINLHHPVKNIKFRAPSEKAYEAWLSHFAVFYEYVPKVRSLIRIPSIHFKALWNLLHWIKIEGVCYEGVFRKSAVKSQVMKLMTAILTDEEVDLECHGILVIAQSCKTLFDRLPDSLFPENVLDALADRPTLKQVKELVQDQFPEPNLQLFKLLLQTCLSLTTYEGTTRMNPSNLSVLFAPTLSSRHIDPIEAMQSYREVSWFIQLCIENYWTIFGTDPPQYIVQVSAIQDVLTNRGKSPRCRYRQFNRFFSFSFFRSSSPRDTKKYSTKSFKIPKVTQRRGSRDKTPPPHGKNKPENRRSHSSPDNDSLVKNSDRFWNRERGFSSVRHLTSLSKPHESDEKIEDQGQIRDRCSSKWDNGTSLIDLDNSWSRSHQSAEGGDFMKIAARVGLKLSSSNSMNTRYAKPIFKRKWSYSLSCSGQELPEEPTSQPPQCPTSFERRPLQNVNSFERRPLQNVNSLTIHRITPRPKVCSHSGKESTHPKDHKLQITRINGSSETAKSTKMRVSSNISTGGCFNWETEHSPASMLEIENVDNDNSWYSCSASLKGNLMEPTATTLIKDVQNEESDSREVAPLTLFFDSKPKTSNEKVEISVLELNKVPSLISP